MSYRFRHRTALRLEFQALLTQEQAVKAQLRDLYESWNTRYREEIAVLKALCKRRPDEWMVDIVRTQALRKFNPRYNELQQEERWLKTSLKQQANGLNAHAGTSWLLYHSVWGTTYSSQGYGAASYAKGAAEQVAFEIAEVHNIETRVVERKRESLPGPRSCFSAGPLSDWDVEVRVGGPLDVEILKRSTRGLGLREWLKACWKKGLNPRVFNPWLPYGIEAKLGVNYQGNDVMRADR